MKILLALCVLSSVASADSVNTYQFMRENGHLVKDHPVRAAARCVSPHAETRVRQTAEIDPKFTIGHDQITMSWVKDGKSHTMGADDVVSYGGVYGQTTGIWHVKPAEGVGSIDVKITINPMVCTKSDCSTWVPAMTVDSIETNNGVTCYEEWYGEGVKL